MPASASASRSARARVRAEITAEILDAAGEELAAEGAAGLSLRAVARRLEMVPSALYRYFPSRDALLTALIIETYEAIGATAGAADAAVVARGGTPMERWVAVAADVRGWAGRHPQRWALVYGSPVPGYQAPAETVAAALLITEVLTGIVRDALAPAPSGSGGAPGGEPEGGPWGGPLSGPRGGSGGVWPAGRPGGGWPAAPPGLADVVAPVRDLLLPGRPAETVVAALMAWTQLIGLVSLELFGHYEGATTDFGPVFTYAMELVGALVGLTTS